MRKEDDKAKELSDAVGTVTSNPALLFRLIGSLLGFFLFFGGLGLLVRGNFPALVLVVIGAGLLYKFGMVGILDLSREAKKNNPELVSTKKG